MGFRVHHLNCGTLCPRPARWVNGAGGFLKAARLVCHCFVVETNDGLALVDTGLGTADVEGEGGRLPVPFRLIANPVLKLGETALSQLRRLGFRREDVRHVVITHLDLDHAGGLSDFPAAAVHLHQVEYLAATQPTRREKMRYRPAQWAHGPRWKTHAHAGERWMGFDSVRPLAGTDDILLIPLFGHSRGHSGVAVRTTTGWLLHAGDAFFARDEIHRTPPSCPPALAAFQAVVAFDDAARRNNQARLRELSSRSDAGVTIVCAHDAAQLDECARARAPERRSTRPASAL
jgi:glyoxylase-like metal-dependent hydrolase (beta-lactamase superfamily II)